MMMNDFIILDELSRSKKGSIYKAKKRDNGKIYVLKERMQAELGKGKNIMNEVDLLRKLKSPFLIECYDHFWNNGSLIMQLEYAAFGDLYGEIQKRKACNRKFTNDQTKLMFQTLANGIQYLHDHNVIHRDIKSLNIFICDSETGILDLLCEAHSNKGYCLKIGDLGVSRECSVETKWIETFYGTPLYCSPEIFDNKPYNTKTDIWSLGVLFYEILNLEMPFRGHSMMSLAKSICSDTKLPYSDDIPDEYRNIVNIMMSQDPDLRPCAAAVVQTLTTKHEKNDEVTPSENPATSSDENHKEASLSENSSEKEIETTQQFPPNEKVTTDSSTKTESTQKKNTEPVQDSVSIRRLQVELRRQERVLQNLKRLEEQSNDMLQTNEIDKVSKKIATIQNQIDSAKNGDIDIIGESTSESTVKPVDTKQRDTAKSQPANPAKKPPTISKENETIEQDYITRMRNMSVRVAQQLSPVARKYSAERLNEHI